MKPGAQSVTTEIGPGCLTAVVRVIIPALRSVAFSDGRIVEEIREVKWSMRRRMFCPQICQVEFFKYSNIVRATSGCVSPIIISSWIFTALPSLISVLRIFAINSSNSSD